MLITEGIRSVREQITERLRAEILSGRLSEGERLQEANLAKQFGVSRGIIREVLAHLEHPAHFKAFVTAAKGEFGQIASKLRNEL